jgi:hypothetical protein
MGFLLHFKHINMYLHAPRQSVSRILNIFLKCVKDLILKNIVTLILREKRIAALVTLFIICSDI